MWDKNRSKAFRRKLLRWYRGNRRALPWREDPNPYKIWISEIMLQQTQTASVLRYYDRFLSRFPDIRSLAQASEPEVLRFWSGLGYYSRARNLHSAAKKIVEMHRSFPEDFDSVIALPGIGRYTAGAICSIAFNQPYPVVDGNVRRVITRLNGVRDRVPENYFWDLMTALIPNRNPSDFNQGMMELGAIVCVPLQPKCPDCPVRIFCEARRLGIETTIPSIHKKRVSARVKIVILVLERRGKIRLSRLSKGDLIPGDWGLPWNTVKEGESPEQIASDLCQTAIGRRVQLESGTPVRHAISNNQIAALGFYGKVELAVARQCSTARFRWENPSSAKALITSSIFRKVLAKELP
jgi:A/G-specific adenine glycosylase